MGAIRPGSGGGGGGASALGDLSDIGTMGEPVAQADDLTEVVTALGGASAVRTAISAAQDGAAPSVTSDAMTGSGWTALSASGGASATWGSSKFACVCPLGSAASCGSYKTGYTASAEWYDVAIRAQVLSADGSTLTRAGFSIGGSSSSNVSINFWNNGTVECGHYDGSTFTSLTSTAGPDSGQRTGGQLWIRITRTPTSVAFSWGVGSAGALPTSWTTVHVSTNATVLLRSGGSRLELFALTTSSLAFSVDILAVKTALPGGF